MPWQGLCLLPPADTSSWVRVPICQLRAAVLINRLAQNGYIASQSRGQREQRAAMVGDGSGSEAHYPEYALGAEAKRLYNQCGTPKAGKTCQACKSVIYCSVTANRMLSLGRHIIAAQLEKAALANTQAYLQGQTPSRLIRSPVTRAFGSGHRTARWRTRLLSP